MTMKSILPMSFPEADAPWLPTLTEIEYRRTNQVPGYENVGFSALVFPADATILTSRKAELEQRFNERYAFRMIGQETLERWQTRLQNRLDEIARPYERAYRLLQENETAMENLVEGYTDSRRDTNSGTKSEGTYSDNSNRSHSDTPYTSVNEELTYADSRDRTTSGGTFSDTTDMVSEGSFTRTRTGTQLQDNVFRSIDRWRDLDTAFTSEFENLFLNVFWY